MFQIISQTATKNPGQGDLPHIPYKASIRPQTQAKPPASSKAHPQTQDRSQHRRMPVADGAGQHGTAKLVALELSTSKDCWPLGVFNKLASQLILYIFYRASNRVSCLASPESTSESSAVGL